MKYNIQYYLQVAFVMSQNKRLLDIQAGCSLVHYDNNFQDQWIWEVFQGLL